MSQWETKRGFIFVTRNDQQMRYGFGRFGLAFRAFQSFPSVQYYPAVVLSSGTNSERNRSKASWDLEGLVMLHFPGEWKRLSATDVCCGGTPFLNLTSFPSSSGERWETGQMQKFVKTRPEFVKSGGEWVGKPHPGQGVPEGDPMALLAVPTGVLPSSLAPPPQSRRPCRASSPGTRWAPCGRCASSWAAARGRRSPFPAPPAWSGLPGLSGHWSRRQNKNHVIVCSWCAALKLAENQSQGPQFTRNIHRAGDWRTMREVISLFHSETKPI